MRVMGLGKCEEQGSLSLAPQGHCLAGAGKPAQNKSLTRDASQIAGGDEIGADVLVSVDGLG